ncbi:MAG: type II secretion system protein [Desulfamplus sp.]|nr:type II secretion system protein [Desulfamplus sp.]
MKRSGYTLFEVMVALIIIGISITAVTGALSTSKGLSARADHSIESVRILKNILNNPELMKQIMENRNFEKMIDDEDGWICRAETTQLVIDSADLVWDSNEGNSRSNVKSDKTAKQRREKRVTKSTKKSVVGEEIEVPGMVNVILCVSQTNQLIQKEYCVVRWKRLDALADTEILTKPDKNENKIK